MVWLIVIYLHVYEFCSVYFFTYYSMFFCMMSVGTCWKAART